MSLYNKKNLVYLICSPLSKRDFTRLGIQQWINRGWKVNVFDITSFLYPEFYKYVDGDKISEDFEGLKVFQNINNLISELKKFENKIVFIDLLGTTITESRIRKIAKTHGVIVKIKLGSIPRHQVKKSIWKKLSLLKKPIKFSNNLKRFIKYNFEKTIAKRYLPNYLVVGGTESLVDVKDKDISIIKAHNLDYDYFIKEKNFKLNEYSNFLVFLDEDGPYHSDHIRLGVESFVKPKNYYPVVDLGLTKIANLLKLNIKIAVHPRSNYGAKKIKYKHPIIQNKTFELIRNSSVVIAHSSTALQWAVIMKKPIIIVTTNEIQKADYAKTYLNLIDSAAKTLGKKTLNLSDLSKINSLKDYLYIDHEKYEKYIEKYIKMRDSPKKLAWDIVIENIESDLLS